MPEHRQDFCDKCGAKTTMVCLACGEAIRGGIAESLVMTSRVAPKYCIHCGAAFPWTEQRLKAARGLAKELLDEKDQQLLDESVQELVRDTPMTRVAAQRFKKLMTRIGREASEAFRDILVDILSETAKKVIWPGA